MTKFLLGLMEVKPFTSAATLNRKSSEKVAIHIYRKATGNHVHKCGLLVNPTFPFVSAIQMAKYV